MYLYVSATWLIANLVHPFMLFIVFGGGGDFMDIFGFGMQFILYSFILSIPSLFLSLLAIYGISKLPVSNNNKFVTWLITALLIIPVNLWMISAISSFEDLDLLSKEGIQLMLPALLSVLLTILVRFTAFFKVAAAFNKEKNENDLKNTNESS